MPEVKYDSETLSWKYDYSDMITPQEIMTAKVVEAIARDNDKKIRNALIDLGWTPPAGFKTDTKD